MTGWPDSRDDERWARLGGRDDERAAGLGKQDNQPGPDEDVRAG